MLNKICDDFGICSIPIQDSGDILNKVLGKDPEYKGYALRFDNFKDIFYDEEAEVWEKRFIIAHELGHHLLGHLRPAWYKDGEGKQQEEEARTFSYVFIALMLFDEYRSLVTAK